MKILALQSFHQLGEQVGARRATLTALVLAAAVVALGKSACQFVRCEEPVIAGVEFLEVFAPVFAELFQ